MSTTRISTLGVNRAIGSVLGAVYILVGLLGFTVSGGSDFAGDSGGKLLGIFMVNPLHNAAHLLVGALLLAGAAGGERAASRTNTLVGGVYLVLAVLGPVVQNGSLNILALNAPDHVLHLASAVLLLLVGLVAPRATSRAS